MLSMQLSMYGWHAVQPLNGGSRQGIFAARAEGGCTHGELMGGGTAGPARTPAGRYSGSSMAQGVGLGLGVGVGVGMGWGLGGGGWGWGGGGARGAVRGS